MIDKANLKQTLVEASCDLDSDLVRDTLAELLEEYEEAALQRKNVLENQRALSLMEFYNYLLDEMVKNQTTRDDFSPSSSTSSWSTYLMIRGETTVRVVFDHRTDTLTIWTSDGVRKIEFGAEELFRDGFLLVDSPPILRVIEELKNAGFLPQE